MSSFQRSERRNRVSVASDQTNNKQVKVVRFGEEKMLVVRFGEEKMYNIASALRLTPCFFDGHVKIVTARKFSLVCRGCEVFLFRTWLSDYSSIAAAMRCSTVRPILVFHWNKKRKT